MSATRTLGGTLSGLRCHYRAISEACASDELLLGSKDGDTFKVLAIFQTGWPSVLKVTTDSLFF